MPVTYKAITIKYADGAQKRINTYTHHETICYPDCKICFGSGFIVSKDGKSSQCATCANRFNPTKYTQSVIKKITDGLVKLIDDADKLGYTINEHDLWIKHPRALLCTDYALKLRSYKPPQEVSRSEVIKTI